MRDFLMAVVVRPAMLVLWCLALWGAAVWLLLTNMALRSGPGAAVDAWDALALPSKIAMALAVLGVAVVLRVVQRERTWRREHRQHDQAQLIER